MQSNLAPPDFVYFILINKNSIQNIKQFAKALNYIFYGTSQEILSWKTYQKCHKKDTSPTKYLDLCRAALKHLKVCRLSCGSICAAQCTWHFESETAREYEKEGEWETKKETPEVGGLTRSICFCFCLAQGQLGAVAKCQQTFECRLSLTCPPSCLALRAFPSPSPPGSLSFRSGHLVCHLSGIMWLAAWQCVKAPKSQFGSLHTEGSWKHVLG